MKVISQTTKERKEETKKLFEQIKPLLDKGYIYSAAVTAVTGSKCGLCYSVAWYRDLINYGESQGYLYKDYSGRRSKKNE